MKKTINHFILIIISMVLFSCFFGSLKASAAEPENILIYSNIYNASTTIDAEFKYEIVPDATNPGVATNEPTEVLIQFNNVAPTSNLTTMTGLIDFSGTSFSTPGTYKYIVSEVSSSNPEYAVSSERYEIYVIVTATDKKVYQQAKNLADDTKGNLNFNHNPDCSYISFNLTTVGDNVDKQEYFRFKVYIDSLCVGCKYDILGQDEYVRYDGETIKTDDFYTVYGPLANNGSQTQIKQNYIYLKDGQTVTIGLTASGGMQIPLGTLVRISGDNNINTRKWAIYIDGLEVSELEHYIGRGVDFDILAERNMLVPNTGIFMESLPSLLLIWLGLCGIYGFLKLREKYNGQSD